MKHGTHNPLTSTFGLLTLLTAPLSAFGALVLYTQVAGEISDLPAFGKLPFKWFLPFENFFGTDFMNPLPVICYMGVVATLIVAAYVCSFLPRFRKRPFVLLMLLHGQLALMLGAFVAAVVPLNPQDTSAGYLGILAVAAVVLAYPLVIWFVERQVGTGLTRLTQRLFKREQYAAGNSVLAVAIRFRPENLGLQRKLGLSRFEAGDILGTIEMLEPLTADSHEDREILSTLEECFRTERLWEKALDMGRRQLALDPTDADTRLRTSQVYDRMDRLDEAIGVLMEGPSTENFDILEQLLAFQAKAENMAAAVEVARLVEKLETGAQKRTLAAYQAVLVADSGNHAALEGLGNLLIRHGNPSDGHACFEEIISGDSQRHDLRKQLVAYYQQEDRVEKTEPHLEALMDAGRDTKDIALLFGDILYQREEYDRALLHFQYAVENYPEDYRFAYFLAQIHLKSQALEDARYWSEEALARAGAKEETARVRVLQERVKEAIVEREMQVWQERCNRDPDNIEIRMNLIEALAGRGFVDKVISECEILIANNPNHAAHVILQLETLTMDVEKNFRLLDYLADLKVKSHRWNEAFEIACKMAERSMDRDLLMTEHCRRILKGHPDHVPSLKCLGEIVHKEKKWDQTLDIYDRLQRLEGPEDDRCLKIVFQAAVEVEDLEKAADTGETLIEMNPLDMAVRLQVIRINSGLKRERAVDAHMQAAQSMDYYNPELVRLKGELDIRRRNQRLDELVAELEQDPMDAEKQMAAGDLYMARAESKKAISSYQHAAKDPQYKDLAGAKQAHALAQIHMYDLAQETVDEITLNIDDPEKAEQACSLIYEVAEMFEGEDESLRALQLYKKIFRVNADFKEVVDKIDKLKDLE